MGITCGALSLYKPSSSYLSIISIYSKQCCSIHSLLQFIYIEYKMAKEIGRTSLLWSLLLAGLLCVSVKDVGAVNFNIVNQCGYTVWAAGSPGGGKQLANGESWSVDVAAGTTGGRFWGRTGCTFDASGKGSCQTGDCGGVLACTAYGSVPATLAEYGLNKFNNLDFFDISLVDGFNIPLSFAPTNGNCQTIACKSDINAVCPSELKVTDGCDSACSKFKTDQYCCTGSYVDRNKCTSTNYSEFFKNQCPQAYSYAYDDATSTFTCASGTTDYKIVFCP